MCYEYFGLPKKTPTVGCFFFPGDFLKMISDLKRYMGYDLSFIPFGESKHKSALIGKTPCPVGLLGDVEIFFLHYTNEQMVKEKWNRRVERINYENLIFKFSFMNGCSRGDLQQFNSLNLHGKKLAFVKNKEDVNQENVYYPGFEHEDQILNDTYFLDRYFDIISFINK